MLVRNDSADAYVRRPPADLRLFLVHGGEEGLVHERAGRLARTLAQAAKAEIVNLAGPAVVADPGLLLDEAYAIGLFGEKRVLWLDADGRDPLGALKPLLEKPPLDCSVVVEAGNLKKGAPLRDAFERANNAACIECYADDAKSLGALIAEWARTEKLTVSKDAEKALSEQLGLDRMTSRGELAKLALYALGTGRIELEDVEAVVADAAPSSLDALIDASLAKDLKGLEAAAARYFADGGDAEEAMRRTVQRVMLLKRVRAEMDQGRGFDAAAQALFVKLPFAAKAALGRQAQIWTSAALAKRLPSIHAAAARVRRDPKMAVPLATRLLWALSSGGR